MAASTSDLKTEEGAEVVAEMPAPATGVALAELVLDASMARP